MPAYTYTDHMTMRASLTLTDLALVCVCMQGSHTLVHGPMSYAQTYTLTQSSVTHSWIMNTCASLHPPTVDFSPSLVHAGCTPRG